MTNFITEEKSIENFSSRVVRAVRKYNRMTQADLASIIGITQGAMSKIEAEILELSAIQWLTICQKFKIPADTIFTGQIEYLKNPSVKFSHGFNRVGSYKIPSRYTSAMGQTARSALALLNYFERKTSKESVQTFLKDLNFDPDYFAILSNPLNLVFLQDLYQHLKSLGLIGPMTMHELFESPYFEKSFKLILEEVGSHTGKRALKNFTNLLNTYYEFDVAYEFISSDRPTFQILIQGPYNLFKLDDDFMIFIKDLREELLYKACRKFGIDPGQVVFKY